MMAGRPLKKLKPRSPAEKIGAAIRRRREALGLSVHQAEVAAGIGRNQWYAIEKGKVTLQRLPRIAAALGCRPAALLP